MEQNNDEVIEKMLMKVGTYGEGSDEIRTSVRF